MINDPSYPRGSPPQPYALYLLSLLPSSLFLFLTHLLSPGWKSLFAQDEKVAVSSPQKPGVERLAMKYTCNFPQNGLWSLSACCYWGGSALILSTNNNTGCKTLFLRPWKRRFKSNQIGMDTFYFLNAFSWAHCEQLIGSSYSKGKKIKKLSFVFIKWNVTLFTDYNHISSY